ncbi:MAG: hypothetical protein AAFZ65_10585 [Planctomycetota bacterium]
MKRTLGIRRPSRRAAPSNRRPARRRSGFTIVEVVLATGILALGASVVLGLLNFGAVLATHSARRADAAAVLPTVVADLEERLFPLLEDGSVGPPQDLVDQPVPGYERLTYSVEAEPLTEGLEPPGFPALYRVQIEIAWTGSGRRRTLEAETLLTRGVPFGARLRRAFIEGDEIRRPLPGNGP